MERKDYERLKQLFYELIELSEEERARRLVREELPDWLRQDLEELLRLVDRY